jgi:hypothetical protein
LFLGVGALLTWLAVVAPADFSRLSPTDLVRVPVEGVLAVVLFAVLPRRLGSAAATVVGVLLALVLVLDGLDSGFLLTLGRPVRPASDWSYLGSAFGLLADSVGRAAAIAIVALACAALATVFVLIPLSVRRIQLAVRRRPPVVLKASGVVALAWIVAALLGVRLGAGPPVASASATALVDGHVRELVADLKDRAVFAKELRVDPYASATGSSLLGGLRGKDVLVVFVESYGRVAVQDSSIADGVDATLAQATTGLRRAGYDSRSAFLTSPTFGGISWLAHSTLQSGVWVDSQERYNTLLDTNRLTLSVAFQRAGWRTVDDVPSNRTAWPPGTFFYHYDHVYDTNNVGYAGPKFGYAPMPDQYVLDAFRRNELTPGPRRPVMAELDLVSSHSPWAPLPRQVPWGSVGDGSVFDPMPAQGSSAARVWTTPQGIRAAYEQSVQYTLATLASFVETSTDPNLVLVVLGDHQPATVVSGHGAGHDVPVSIVARDPAVLARISGWGWQRGLLPSPTAPVWRMDTFRNRFLSAYSR